MSWIFIVKKVLGTLIMPLPLASLLVLLALMGGILNKGKFAMLMLSIAAFIVLLCSFRPFALSLITPLENAYQKYADQPVQYVVVLGGWHKHDPRVPVTSVLSSYSTARLLEGIRIYRLNPGSQLVLSGYPGLSGKVSNASAMQSLALALGVPEQDMLLEERPRDTAQEAALISETIGTAPFALVSSASHLRRAIALFHAQGVAPIAAPTDYLSKDNGERTILHYVPNAASLRITERALHEYLGYWWAQMRGQIP